MQEGSNFKAYVPGNLKKNRLYPDLTILYDYMQQNGTRELFAENNSAKLVNQLELVVGFQWFSVVFSVKGDL